MIQGGCRTATTKLTAMMLETVGQYNDDFELMSSGKTSSMVPITRSTPMSTPGYAQTQIH